MSAANNKWIKWQQIAGIGVVCSLAVAGCSRSDNAEDTKAPDAVEETAVDNSAVAPAVACDDPLVQDRLKNALRTSLNQQAQALAANYANNAEVNLDGGTVKSKVNGIIVDVNNITILQEANANGMTTCQASVSMTLPSEDLYQASEVDAANNLPSLQTRLAQDNIRINNNMLVDDAFTYVVGAQAGQVQARIAGQPAIITAVADVMAASTFKAVIDNQRVQRQAQETKPRREAAKKDSQNQPVRQPKPVAPAQPAQPASPPKVNKSAEQNEVKPNTEPKASAAPKTPVLVPKDDSIDMVIIEDDSATY